jgi:hypothetical protein
MVEVSVDAGVFELLIVPESEAVFEAVEVGVWVDVTVPDTDSVGVNDALDVFVGNEVLEMELVAVGLEPKEGVEEVVLVIVGVAYGELVSQVYM